MLGPFACDVAGCDKTFATAASLAGHKVSSEACFSGNASVLIMSSTRSQRTHGGVKEHVCPHCDK